MDWLKLCPSTGSAVKISGDDLFNTPLDQAEIDFENEGGETYICGNPPYLGAKKKTDKQVADMDRVGLGKAKLLDYVAAFIVKGLEYMNETRAEMALVSTSSICQGEQVARSEEHTSELQSLMRTSYAVFCLKKKQTQKYSKSNH